MATAALNKSAAVLFFTLIKNRVYIIYELLSLEVAGVARFGVLYLQRYRLTPER